MRKPHLALCLLSLLSMTERLGAEDWPGFRGPGGQGRSGETGLPIKWSATENVAWKTAIPGEGWSSPIAWGERVFVTTAAEGGVSCRVLALDQGTGKILWDREAFRQELRNKQEKNSYATPTPVTDGERIFAVFGDGGISALAMDGSVLWLNREQKHYSQHGLGASPILHGDLLFMVYDGSSSGEDKKVGWKTPWDQAVILAVEKATGKVRWRGSRGKSRIAHVTPSIYRAGGRVELVSGAGDVVQGFDPTSGERLWTLFSKGEGVVPSIVVGDGLIYSSSGFEDPTIRAVRTGGRGEVTGSHLAWEQKTGAPTQASLIYLKPYLYSITDQGVVHCFQGEEGKLVWKHRIGGNHCASPIATEGRIYFLSEDGESVVMAAGPEPKELARNTIGERCQASYAVSNQRIFIRSAKNLFCIVQAGQ